jgi:EF-P beta-lysylation protein EpmB
LLAAPGYGFDPLAESAACRAPGLMQKYAGRALLVLGTRCAVHCRYCFRRHFPYEEVPRGMESWRPALDLLAADGSIHEVIFSGGDPLMLDDRSLAALVQELERIPHLQVLRLHTRLPVVLPERVDEGLVHWLGRTRLTRLIVLHANHPQELDSTCRAAIDCLRRSGALLLNQAVLLRGVNDRPETLVELGRRLVECGVLPYYLHQLDPVAGAAHFEVPVAEGLELLEAMRRRLPGYAVPKFVQEVPGEPFKMELESLISPTDSSGRETATLGICDAPVNER